MTRHYGSPQTVGALQGKSQYCCKPISDLKTQIARRQRDLIVQQPSKEFSELRKEVPEEAIFTSVVGKNCGGFRASEIHCRCDGNAYTLTVILDTEGNIFGGLTPVKWESPTWNGKWEGQ
jgi:hypothetical protein